MNNGMQIVNLYHQLEGEIRRTTGNNGAGFGMVMEYGKTLAEDEFIILNSIREFRNHYVNDCDIPELPENYQVWIEFLTDKLGLLKNKKNK